MSEKTIGETTGATIFALSTASARAAIAVIRLSGASCHNALTALGVTDMPAPRMAGLRALHHPKSGALLDEALVLRFAAPQSFTGEDMAELHVHGGLAVTASVLDALSEIDGLRPAAPGDFTRRAVLNGKMDLTAAEAIADLIDAEGGAQQAQALDQLRGQLRHRAEGWRDSLTAILAHLEADLEFADEDLPGGVGQKALHALPDLQKDLAMQLDDGRGLRLRDGIRIALVGAPNVGKSSILNMLAGRDAAIVSARAGTTRDAVEVAMLLAGVPVTLIDTAGLRAAGDDIEREGVRRAVATADMADIVILVNAVDTPADDATDDEMKALMARADLHLVNKSDLGGPPPSGWSFTPPAEAMELSATTGAGAEALVARLTGLVVEKTGQGGGALVTRQRHQTILRDVVNHIGAAQRAADAAIDGGGGLELAAEDLRLAQRALGRLTGAVDVEQLLDVVFADFCIGK